LAAVRELRRALRTCGILYLSFPFGRAASHGWLQILDQRMVERVIEAFEPRVQSADYRNAGLDLYSWIEVAWNPKLAAAHPHRMAALGSNEDWQKSQYLPGRSAQRQRLCVQTEWAANQAGSGALFASDDTLADTARGIRCRGGHKRYHHPLLGVNGRFDTIQASVLLAKSPHLEWEVDQRGRLGARPGRRPERQ